MSKFGQEFFFLFLIYKEKQSDFNILLHKTVLSITQNLNYATNLNDGSQMHCLSFDANTRKVVVFDLGRVFSISRMEINNNVFRTKNPINFYLGNSFQACQFQIN